MPLPRRYEVRVLDVRGKAIADAIVTARRDSQSRLMTLAFDPDRRIYSLPELLPGDYLVTASPDPNRSDLEGQERLVTVTERGLSERFILGRPGIPFYYRGRTKVPFDLPEMVAVVVKAEARAQIADLVARANLAGLRRLEVPDAIADQYVAVFQAESASSDAGRFELDAAEQRFVRHAGRVVRLDAKGISFLTGEYSVKLRTGEDITQVAAAKGIEVVRFARSSPDGALVRVRGRSSIESLQLINAWAEDASVIWAEPNLFTTARLHETVPQAVKQGHHFLLQTAQAWTAIGGSESRASSPATIAVTDLGCDQAHPDLSSKIRAYFNFETGSTSPVDDPHGTKACGVAAGSFNTVNGVEVVGVAPMCDLVVARRGGSDWDYAAMFEWCAGLGSDYYGPGTPAALPIGADVISNSWGLLELAPSGLVGDALSYVSTGGRGGLGCVIVFSVGNDGDDYAYYYPLLDHEAIIRVGASTISPPDPTEAKVSDSNFGWRIDVCAPGGEAAGGALVLAPTAAFDYKKDGYAKFGQTSCACAQVAGVAALMLTVNPALTAEQVRNCLHQTSVQIDAGNAYAPYVNGYSQYYGFGRVDAAAAVAAASSLP
jgi:hypothetical protein